MRRAICRSFKFDLDLQFLSAETVTASLRNRDSLQSAGTINAAVQQFGCRSSDVAVLMLQLLTAGFRVDLECKLLVSSCTAVNFCAEKQKESYNNSVDIYLCIQSSLIASSLH